MISKLDPSTYLLTNKDETKNDRWVVNFYKEMRHPLSDRVEFKMKDGKLYVSEIIKNVSYYNGEEIVSYSDDNKHCLYELFEKGIIVGLEIADWNFAGRPDKIWISHKDKNYNPLLVWNIVEKM